MPKDDTQKLQHGDSPYKIPDWMTESDIRKVERRMQFVQYMYTKYGMSDRNAHGLFDSLARDRVLQHISARVQKLPSGSRLRSMIEQYIKVLEVFEGTDVHPATLLQMLIKAREVSND